MKFFCDNCSTQYLISDDKVGPKGVKVRCKRCGNVIVVRPGEPVVDDARQDAVVTDNDGAPFGAQTGADESDDVGQAFDQLLQGGLDDAADDDDGEEQATEVFRMEDVKRNADNAPDHDIIDRVFAGAESTGRDPKANGADEELDSDWYVAIGDEQVGPMDVTEIETRWQGGEIGPDTLAWHAGMSDWTTVSEIPRLRYLLGSGLAPAGERESTEVDAPGSRESAPPAKAPEDEWAPQTSSELSSLVEEEIASVASQPPPEDDAPLADDPVASILPGDDGDIPPWEMDDPPSGEVAKPSDSYFDSSLDKGAGEGDEAYNNTYSRSGRVLAGPAYLGGRKQTDSKAKWAIIGALAVLILGGGTVIAFMLGGDGGASDKVTPAGDPGLADGGLIADGRGATAEPGPGDQKPDEANKPDAGEEPKDGPKAGADGQPGDGGKPDEGKPGDDGAPAEDGPKEIVVKKPVPRADNGPSNPRIDKPKDRPGSGTKRKKRKDVAVVKPPVDKPKPPDPPSADADGNLPKKLSKAQISGTMKKYIKAMRSCVEQQKQRDPSVTGTMQVSFDIQPDGSVQSVTVKTPEHKGTYVAGCISFIIKSMKFPKAQQPFTVPVLPLKLGG